MHDEQIISNNLNEILELYRRSFEGKVYDEENNDHDLLMDIFGITPEIKRENRQYWGRELGMCWQLLVVEVCRLTRDDFGAAIRVGSDVPCDLTVGKYAIDTKYRIGSGDAGTLKKFKAYGPLLISRGFEPLLLIVRNDNLSAAVHACVVGGWTVLIGEDTYNFIHDLTSFDLKHFLTQKAGEFSVHR